MDRFAGEPWFLDGIHVSDVSATISGWSFPRPDGRPTQFLANGAPLAEVHYPVPRPDVREVFWQRRHAEMSGFTLKTASESKPYVQGMLTISRSSPTRAIEAGRDSWYLPDPALHQDLPDEDRRFRVIGDRNAAGFLNTGATDLMRLNHVAVQVTGKALWDHARVLDWGVGCGRLARHFPNDAAGQLSGCDMDHDNVDWCAANLRGHFVRSTINPPLPFRAASFDLIYGVSIFTHLREPLQDAWLAELHRVAAEGALVLTTIHGATALEFFHLPPDQYTQLKRKVKRMGLLVDSKNSQLDGHADGADDYVNVFHTDRYVRTHWSKLFDVVDVLPGYIYTHDLVVLRAKKLPASTM